MIPIIRKVKVYVNDSYLSHPIQFHDPLYLSTKDDHLLLEDAYDSDFSLFSFNDQEVIGSIHTPETSPDYDSKHEPETFNGKSWTQSDDDTLKVAVQTLGTSYWSHIAHHWIMGGKGAKDCLLRWQHLGEEQSNETKKTRSITGNGDRDHHDIMSRTSRQRGINPMSMPALKPKARFKQRKPLTARRRKELEALEERRLFGKSTRSMQEHEMIHRAYLVGHLRLEQVLKMNSIKELKRSGKDAPHISVASIMTEMKRISRSDVHDNAQAINKSLKKLPKNILSLKDEDIMSPDSKEQKSESQDNTHFLDFDSSALPVATIIDSVNEKMVEKKSQEKYGSNSSDDDSYSEFEKLQECISPPLNHAFPCLPLPKLPRHLSGHTKPIPILFFRS